MKKRILSILLAVVIVAGLMPGMALATSAAGTQPTYSGGTGTAADPYILSTPADLVAFHTAISCDDGSLDTVDTCGLGMYHGYYFKLANDIDMSGIAWTPVSFCGNLDGADYTIRNLSVTEADNGSGEYWAAMFGQLINATVSNIVFENCSVTISSTVSSGRDIYVAIVAANAIASKMENITVNNSTVTQNGYAKNMGYAAFVAALADISHITGCVVEGGSISVTAPTTNPMNVGGITGCFEDLYYEFIAWYDNPYNMAIGAGSDYGIYDCYVNANISVDAGGASHAAGIVGMTCTDFLDDTQEFDGVAVTIQNCAYKGTITTVKGTASGISGWDEPEDRIIDCVSMAVLSAPNTCVFGDLPETVTGSYYLADEENAQGGRTAAQFADGSVCAERGEHFLVEGICPLCGFAVSYAIQCESAVNGSVSADKTSATRGETVTLTVTPAENYGLKTLIVDGDDVTARVLSGKYSFAMPAANVTVTATFEKNAYEITVIPSENGTVVADPAVSAEGQPVTLTVIPNAGYETDAVTVKDENGRPIDVTDNGDGTYTYIQPAGAVSIEVTYEKNDTGNWMYWLMMLYSQQFDISAAATEGGAITPAGISEVKYDKSITYTIIPADGYILSDVLVDGKSVGAVTTYTFENVKANHTISAVFVKAAWDNPFSDVSADDWFCEDIRFVTETGLMNGMVENETFAPELTLTRAMLVTVLWRLEGSPTVDYLMQFADVPTDEWYTEAVRWAAANEIILGYDGLFMPEDPVTREQMAAIFHRYAVHKELDAGIDAPAHPQYTVSDWAETDVDWAAENGLLTDIPTDMSDMTDDATRAEAAAMLRRFCGKFLAE